MISPFTDGNAVLKTEQRDFVFRKESFTVLYHYYVCEGTKEQFTTDELDELNLSQVHNKYREKYGIPFTNEIARIRKEYGLSASKMSEVLGLGINSYRNYESGEIPSVASGRLIRLAADPDEFLKLLEMSRNTFEPPQYQNVLKKIQHLVSPQSSENETWMQLLFNNRFPNILNGYKTPSLQTIGNMVCFFAKNNKPFTTALNKLMFYADFGHFKRYGHSISGVYYKAIERGPVPENYGSIYNVIVNLGFAKIEENDFGDFIGERFVPGRMEEGQPFTELELDTLTKVSNKFRNMTTKTIVELSHEEPAWQNNVKEKNRISFEYSFELKHAE